jgi:curved DNA-binding protein CbpA
MNYYEMLGIGPDAGASAIETMLDEQYEKWRGLVTNHDPSIVGQANQALRSLEEIRSTLLDPTKRGEYDDALRKLEEGVGGLSDPALFDPSKGMTPPQKTPQPPPQPKDIIVGNTWVCLKCSQLNPVMTKFCRECGHQIGIECPNCGSLTQEKEKYCSKCGVNIKQAIIDHEEAQRQAELVRQKEIAIEPIRKKAEAAFALSSYWWFILIGYNVIFYLIAIGKANKALSLSQIPGDEQYRTLAVKAKKRARNGLLFFLVFILPLICLGLFQTIGSN